jgi:TPR repeat protein
MSGQIFISYRRDDASHPAGRLYDRLSAHFTQSQIFIDVDNIPPGIDFVEVIEQSVGSCNVLVAVIGKRWLSSADEEGRRRLDNPEDFVRLEIATALKRGIRVIPVLVDGASMPRSGELPDDLKSLVRRQALTVSHERFRADAERLIGAVEQVLESAARAEQQRKREEQERAEAERREREEKERLEAESRQKEPQDRLEAERQEGEQYEKVEQPAKGVRRVSARPPPSAAEWLAEAKHYLDAKDYANALPLLQRAAEAGNASAMYNLGVVYQNGWGVDKDYAQARQWYQKAAEAGNTDAMSSLAWLYENGWGGPREYTQARQWYQKATDASDAYAKKALSRLSSNRSPTLSGVDWFSEAKRYLEAKDCAKALPLLHRAAEAGNADAMYNLGNLYQYALGAAQDFIQARYWHQKAAEAGNADAMRSLAWLYENGWGGPREYTQARQWYQKAAAAGDAKAKQALSRLPRN